MQDEQGDPLGGLLQGLQKQLPSTPMTGTGNRAGGQAPAEVPPDNYVIPARPSTLSRDSDPGQSLLVRLARRRLGGL